MPQPQQRTRSSFLSILLILTLALELVSHSDGRSIGVAPGTNDVVGVASHASRQRHTPRHNKPTRRDAFGKFSNDKNNEGEDHSNLKAPSGAHIQSITVSKSTGSTANDDDKDNDDKGEADIDVFWGDPKTDQKAQATKAFIIIHGRLRDGATYWQTMSDVLQSAVDAGYPGADSKAFVIAPQFFSEVYNKGQYSSSTLAFADTNAWVAGDIATHPRGTHLTSFDALDSIIRIFSNRTEYPSLRNITLVGHGGGGQMVARYAMVGNADEVVNELVDFENGERGIHVRYLVGDPSSQAYFTGDRPVGMEVMGMSKVNASSSSSNSDWQGGDPSCEWWNTWRYGFDGFNYTTYSSSSPTDPNADPNADPNSLSTNLLVDDDIDNSSSSSSNSSNSSSLSSSSINSPSPRLPPNTYISSLSLSSTSSYPLTPIDLFARYVSRDIILILGLDDTKPNGDQYCPALLQGGTARVYRNLAWWSYVNTLARTKEPVQMLMEWVNERYASGAGKTKRGKKDDDDDDDDEKDDDDDENQKDQKDEDDSKSKKNSSSHKSKKSRKKHHRQHHDDDDDEDSGSSSSSSSSTSSYTLSFSSLPNWSNVTYKSGLSTRLIIVQDAGHDAVDVLSGKEGRSALFLSGIPVGVNGDEDADAGDGTENGEILIGWRPDGWNETESDCSMCDESKENLGKEGTVPDSSNSGSGSGSSNSSSSSSTDGNGAVGFRSFGTGGGVGVWATTMGTLVLVLVTL